MPKVLAISLAVAALAAAGTASALTATTSFSVTATVLKTCSTTATTLGFGNYTPGTGALTANTTVNVKCTKGTGFTVALDKGTTATGTIAQRLMTNGTDTLQYNLFTTAAFATIFGDGTTGVTQAGTGTGLASNVALTVFGSLPDNAANQAVSPGSYTDTIGVVVTY
jgi:spore coat protein U-like protein